MRWAAAVVVAVLALGLRLGYLFELHHSPLFGAPVVDAATYLADARYLTEVSWAGRPMPYWQPPLYPYLLAVLRGVGDSLWWPRLLQVAAGVGTCLLVWVLGLRWFGAPVAFAAALAAAAYGPAIYFTGELLPVTLALCLDLACLWLLLRLPPGAPAWRWLLPGAVLGLSALTVANVLAVVPLLLWWLWRYGPQPGEPAAARLRRGLWLVVGCAAVITPVTARNLVVGDELVLISHNVGVNFYIGNNPDYDGTVAIRPGDDWLDLVERPVEAGVEGYAARSRWFFARSAEFLRDDPLGFAALLLRKTFLFWRGEEIPRNLDPYYARNEAPVLAALLWHRGVAFPFGLIGPLALVGLAAYLRDRRNHSREGALLVGFVLAYAAGVVLFFVTSRYRLPVVPLLLLFAAEGGRVVLTPLLRRRPWPRALAPLAAVLLLGVTLNAGHPVPAVASPALEHYWRGWAYQRLGMPANAYREYRGALRLDPDLGDALLNTAALEAQKGKTDAAVGRYQRYLEREGARQPDRVRLDLAMTLMGAGRYPAAAAQLETLTTHQPERPGLQGVLAYAYLGAKRPEAAARAYRRVLALRPDSVLVRYQLARLHESQERPDSAEAQYRILLGIDPDDVDARVRLAGLLVDGAVPADAPSPLRRSRPLDEAETLLRGAVAADSTCVDALWSLGRLLAREGRFREAIPPFEHVLSLDPSQDGAHLYLGQLYERTGRSEEAEAHFKRYAQALREQRLAARAMEQKQELMREIFGGARSTPGSDGATGAGTTPRSQ